MSVEEINTKLPDKDVIEYLEDLLSRAKSGHIQSIATIVSYGNYHTANGWAGMWKNNMAVIGETESLKVDLMRYFVEQRVEYVEE